MMEDIIFDAATLGDVSVLRNTIENNSSNWNKFVAGCFNWNPLHVAACFGHKEFAQELLTRNPQLARALDLQGRSPLHLAAQEGNIVMVELLLNHGSYMCLSRDRDGRSPLHVAAVNGKVEVLRKLLEANSNVARARLDRDENVLHLCVKHSQFDSLKLLLETITDEDFVNAKDRCGNTILHVAVYTKELEVTEYVLHNTQIEVNAINTSDQTALDISLKLEKTAKGEEKEKLNTINGFLKRATGERAILMKKFDWTERKNILMVVVSVLAALSFQAVLNPPGGVWQDDKDGHRAGKAILASQQLDLYIVLLLLNMLAFSLSLYFMLLFSNAIRIHSKFIGFLLTIYCTSIIFLMGIYFFLSIYAVTPFEEPMTSAVLKYELKQGRFTTRSLLDLIMIFWSISLSLYIICYTGYAIIRMSLVGATGMSLAGPNGMISVIINTSRLVVRRVRSRPSGSQSGVTTSSPSTRPRLVQMVSP